VNRIHLVLVQRQAFGEQFAERGSVGRIEAGQGIGLVVEMLVDQFERGVIVGRVESLADDGARLVQGIFDRFRSDDRPLSAPAAARNSTTTQQPPNKSPTTQLFSPLAPWGRGVGDEGDLPLRNDQIPLTPNPSPPRGEGRKTKGNRFQVLRRG